MAIPDGEARVLATAQHIVKALCTTDTMTDDMLHILSRFDHRFSSMNAAKEDVILPTKGSHDSEIHEDYYPPAPRSNFELDAAENVVVKWDNGYSEQLNRQNWVFEAPEDDTTQYLHAVDEIVHQLGSMKLHNRDPGTLERAQSLLQLAMQRLQDEFRHMLEKYSERVDPNWLLDSLSAGYFRASVNEVVDPEESGSEEDDDDEEDVLVAQPVDRIETAVDLIPPEVVRDLSDIAKRLVGGGNKRECIQMYVSARKPVLEESLYELGVERVSIDEVQKMPWEMQEDCIKKWNQAMNVGVKVLFASEKQLCNEVNSFTSSSEFLLCMLLMF